MCERELNEADIFPEDLNIFADKKGNKQTTAVLFQASQAEHRVLITPKAGPLCLVLSICLFSTPVTSPYPCLL